MKDKAMRNAIRILFVVIGLCVTGFGQLSITGNGTQVVDFSTAITGVNNGIFNGTGFTPTPGAGQLDSDAFAITGFSDGALAFGGTQTTGDFARGGTTGGVTTGGLYAYTPNPAIYIQPGGSDFVAPGTITLRIQNNGTSIINQLTLTYDILVRNDQARANSFNFSFSIDDATYFPVSGLDYTSTEVADPAPAVATIGRGPVVIGGLSLAPGAFFYVRWSGADVSGTGSRDEFGLDNISVTAQFQLPATTFTVLNEIEVDNPGPDDNSCEYVEVRGDANSGVSGRLYLLQVEGDGGFAGRVDTAIDLNGRSFGSNGLMTISGVSVPTAKMGKNLSLKSESEEIGVPVCSSRNYESAGSTYFPDTSLVLGNGTVSFMLVSTASVINVNDDLDTNNDGVIDNLPLDAVIIDAVGWTDAGVGDRVYGGVDVTPGNTSGSPDAATRNFNNIMPLTVSAWFADDLVNSGNINSVLYDQTNLFGGYRIDFITPGRQNLAPSAAAGSISGRARTAAGNGVKYAVIMLTGGPLQEPRYATTNEFGNYQLNDVPVGHDYVIRITSGRFTFVNPIRLVNLLDSISNEDFILDEPGAVK